MHNKTILITGIDKINVKAGGVHRISKMLMEHLPQYGFKCLYLAKEYNAPKYYINNDLIPENLVDIERLRNYVLEEQIDIILDQQSVFSDEFASVYEQLGCPSVKYLTMYHNTPLIFAKLFNRARIWDLFLTANSAFTRVTTLGKWLFYPIWKRWMNAGCRKKYLHNYNVSDRTILLSEGDRQAFASYVGLKESSKCVVINNPLSFEKVETEDCLLHKKNEVLIVSRLNNFEKRLDRALKIWKILQNRGLTDIWHLTIVGWGLQEQMLHDLSKKLNLKNVTFVGRQDPEEYYHSASLFMLTSAVEGWGLTLTESMQTGVVPLAFDSYPALKSIVTDGYDGCIIEDDNLEAYADRMEYLMTHQQERERMAKNGLESCKRFTIDKIVAQWVDMINGL